MKQIKIGSVLLLLSLAIFSCSSENEEAKKPVPQVALTDTTTFSNDVLGFGNKTGVVGIFKVPEMLVLSIIDSAQAKDVASKLINNYAILEEEMNATGAEMNGPIGVINYNNNPKNFIFESVLCIKRFPKKQPTRCKIVILEASPMLVFNFYGPYQNLFGAYDKIKDYCRENSLIQMGQMREFYITDPEKEKDPTRWLTRILLPVTKRPKK
jgi:effector-binding domain-containing protein